jgi:hypothetical protein
MPQIGKRHDDGSSADPHRGTAVSALEYDPEDGFAVCAAEGHQWWASPSWMPFRFCSRCWQSEPPGWLPEHYRFDVDRLRIFSWQRVGVTFEEAER